jgi:hypothetical protein
MTFLSGSERKPKMKRREGNENWAAGKLEHDRPCRFENRLR